MPLIRSFHLSSLDDPIVVKLWENNETKKKIRNQHNLAYFELSAAEVESNSLFLVQNSLSQVFTSLYLYNYFFLLECIVDGSFECLFCLLSTDTSFSSSVEKTARRLRVEWDRRKQGNEHGKNKNGLNCPLEFIVFEIMFHLINS